MRTKKNSEIRTRLIQRGRFVVAVPINVVYPADMPDEPCYGPEAVKLLKEVAEKAEAGDVAWLKRHGTVYELLEKSTTASANHGASKLDLGIPKREPPSGSRARSPGVHRMKKPGKTRARRS